MTSQSHVRGVRMECLVLNGDMGGPLFSVITHHISLQLYWMVSAYFYG